MESEYKSRNVNIPVKLFLVTLSRSSTVPLDGTEYGSKYMFCSGVWSLRRTKNTARPKIALKLVNKQPLPVGGRPNKKRRPVYMHTATTTDSSYDNWQRLNDNKNNRENQNK